MATRYVGELPIDLGEKVHVKSVVKPKCDSYLPFTIKSARYQLWDEREVLEAEGDCTISEHTIDALVEPLHKGIYCLKYIYEIADEIWVDNIKLKVG